MRDLPSCIRDRSPRGAHCESRLASGLRFALRLLGRRLRDAWIIQKRFEHSFGFVVQETRRVRKIHGDDPDRLPSETVFAIDHTDVDEDLASVEREAGARHPSRQRDAAAFC